MSDGVEFREREIKELLDEVAAVIKEHEMLFSGKVALRALNRKYGMRAKRLARRSLLDLLKTDSRFMVLMDKDLRTDVVLA